MGYVWERVSSNRQLYPQEHVHGRALETEVSVDRFWILCAESWLARVPVGSVDSPLPLL